MKIDTHTHSKWSFDGEEPVERLVHSAAAAGVSVLTVTDHAEIDCFAEHDLKNSIAGAQAEIAACQKDAPVLLLRGIELGQPLCDKAHTEALLSAHPYDMVIGSIHTVTGYEDFYFLDYENMEDDALASLLYKYYDELLSLAQCNRFDTLAHPIYPYRYFDITKRGTVCAPERFDAAIEQVCRTLIRNEKALELNTATFARGGQELSLYKRYLSMYHDCGGTLITVGSDAHQAADVGRYFDEAKTLLKEIGFSSAAYFKNRQPVLVAL